MAALIRHDLRCLKSCALLGGVDEAGRGALAGPVVAGAVFIDARFLRARWVRREWSTVNDSKQLSLAERERLFGLIKQARQRGELFAESGVASVQEIAALNILGATRLAMARALEAACPEGVRLGGDPEDTPLFAQESRTSPKVRVLLDGRPMRPFPFPHEAIVRGDGSSFAIALASIVAKVTRDRLMVALDTEQPRYGFAEHKGYGTPAHRAALRTHGPCPFHRALFLRKVLTTDPETEEEPLLVQ